MPTFVASNFLSQQKWRNTWSSLGDRFQQNICTLDELPKTVSALRWGENIMIRHEGANTESGEEGHAAFGHFVLWTTSAAVDQAWDLLKREFLQNQLGQAVAIAARKQKADWCIEEFKRPFGECRLTVSTPDSSDISYQTETARQIADLLSNINISNIFYVANTDIDEARSMPGAARRTSPVYESPSHHLVYVHQDFPAAAQTNTNTVSSSLPNLPNPISSRDARSQWNNTAIKSGPDGDKWHRPVAVGQWRLL